MAFFRKWKTHYKHKKFSSDEIVDGEEDYDYGLSPHNLDSIKFQLDGHGGGGSSGGHRRGDNKTIDLATEALHLHKNNNSNNNNNSGDNCDDGKLYGSFDIRYLGSAPITSKPNEKITSEAIAQVIANAKAGGRKNKTHKRVKLNITHEYLQVLDYLTQDTLMCFTIYKISYCSVDAAHDHAFAFVGAERNPMASSPAEDAAAVTAAGADGVRRSSRDVGVDDEDRLSCHVFLCPKRKVAHEITLLVARCFERAYQQWRDAVILQQRQQHQQQLQQQQQQQQQHQQRQVNNHAAFDSALSYKKPILIESRVEVHQPQRQQQEPLIDLHVPDSDTQKCIQHSWVSFDDDGSGCGAALQVAAC